MERKGMEKKRKKMCLLKYEKNKEKYVGGGVILLDYS